MTTLGEGWRGKIVIWGTVSVKSAWWELTDGNFKLVLNTYSQVRNKRGGQNKRGSFKDFEKLFKRRGQNKRGVGTKYKRKETKIGLLLLNLLTSLNIGISSILRRRRLH